MKPTRLLAFLFLVANLAWADETSATRERASTRVRSSHTVDVIAPTEKVETVLDRMRHTGPRLERGERPEFRGPPGRGNDRGRANGPRENGRMSQHHGGGPGPRDGRNDGPPPPSRRPPR